LRLFVVPAQLAQTQWNLMFAVLAMVQWLFIMMQCCRMAE
jgi:hypothetical protein